MSTVDVSQFKENFHVPKEAFRQIITMEDLDFVDLKVLCYLLTTLNGYNKLRRMGTSKENEDPCNFSKVHASVLAEELGFSEKKVKKSIKYLTEIGLLEKGNGPAVKGGYRFTF